MKEIMSKKLKKIIRTMPRQIGNIKKERIYKRTKEKFWS